MLAACGGATYQPARDPSAYLSSPVADCSDLSAWDQSQPWAVWQEVPEFGGVILDQSFVHSIRMTELKDVERLWKWYPTDAKYVQVRFSWGELVRVKCQMSNATSDPDAVFLDADEAANRVRVEVVSGAALERVSKWADLHATPRDAVIITIGERISAL